MSDTPVEVYVAKDAFDAQRLVDQLRFHGVEARIHRDQGAFAGTWFDSPRVLVPKEHEEFSRVIVARFDRERVRNPSADPEPTDDIWPTCPQCQSRRLTICPRCHTAGNQFPQGFSPDDQTVRMCPTCEEPFVPEYYRHCHHCRHDFGEGREPVAALGGEVEMRENIFRTWAVLIAIVAGIGTLVWYFSRLLG